ncbi:hypothetical protein K439DRAFT_1624429 [Ramaria rubella]|nr:hypothetical protein K439DRAFT_1624429 [Ramaria rubella]
MANLGAACKAVHDLELELLQAALQPLHARQGPETCEPSSQPLSPVCWGLEARRETRTSLTIIKLPQNWNLQRVEWDIKLQDRELQRIDWEYYAQSAEGSDAGVLETVNSELNVGVRYTIKFSLAWSSSSELLQEPEGSEGGIHWVLVGNN